MYCSSCGAGNPEGKRYCDDRGAAMPVLGGAELQQSHGRALTMRLVYMRQWMWGCLYTGASSLAGAVVLGAAFGEPALAALMAVCGLIMLAVGIRLLKEHGTGWNE